MNLFKHLILIIAVALFTYGILQIIAGDIGFGIFNVAINASTIINVYLDLRRNIIIHDLNITFKKEQDGE